MRIWDIDPSLLCFKHLNGEHRELHAIWNIIRFNKNGYSKHPETLRWVGKLDALKIRHDNIVIEMCDKKPTYNHKSDLSWVNDCTIQNKYVNTLKEQIDNVNNKKCDCVISIT